MILNKTESKIYANTTHNIVFESKEDHPQTGHISMRFCPCDLDLDPMTLTYELDVDVLNTCMYTNHEVSRSRLSKVGDRTEQTERETDRQTDTRT